MRPSLARRPCKGRWCLRVGLVVACLLGGGCPSENSTADGGSLDRSRPTDAEGESPAPRAVDFFAQGCLETAGGQCRGPAPLSVTFSAVTIGVAQEGEWDFGDGSAPRSGWVVSHLFVAPGEYDVSLTVSVEGGTVSEEKQAHVKVVPAGPGQRCVVDGGCASGSCICREGCAHPFSSNLCLDGDCQPAGICLNACEKVSCPVGTACVDLGLGAAGPAEAWRTILCLPTCNDDGDCPGGGYGCRLAPGMIGWRQVCLPPFPRFVGAPCRDLQGRPDGALCLGGLCLDIGASGYCSVLCAAGRCPEGTGCARFVGADDVGLPAPVCLLRCTEGSCESDPLLGCQLSGQPGSYGIEVVGRADPPGTEYCGVRPCAGPEDCGLTGSCDEATGGYCRPSSSVE